MQWWGHWFHSDHWERLLVWPKLPLLNNEPQEEQKSHYFGFSKQLISF